MQRKRTQENTCVKSLFNTIHDQRWIIRWLTVSITTLQYHIIIVMITTLQQHRRHCHHLCISGLYPKFNNNNNTTTTNKNNKNNNNNINNNNINNNHKNNDALEGSRKSLRWSRSSILVTEIKSKEPRWKVGKKSKWLWCPFEFPTYIFLFVPCLFAALAALY